MNINTPISPIPEPNHPPDSLNLEELTTLPISPSSSLTLLQLKAHRSEAVLHNVLHSQSYHVLMIQEPWVSKFTLLPAVHPAWHLITPMGHTPKTLDERMKTCIYISKTVPTKAFTSLPTKSPLLTAIDIDDPLVGLHLRLLSWYNPPTDFSGLPVLRSWLQRFNRRRTPTLLTMDSNLHHRSWNPTYQRRTHTQSLELMSMCGSHSFKIISPKGVPTFYPP